MSIFFQTLGRILSKYLRCLGRILFKYSIQFLQGWWPCLWSPTRRTSVERVILPTFPGCLVSSKLGLLGCPSGSFYAFVALGYLRGAHLHHLFQVSGSLHGVMSQFSV